MRLVEDETWAVMTLVAEASGEPYEAQLAVAEVIRNRTATRYNSDGTVIGTVLAAAQFSCWSTRDKNRLRVARMDWDDPAVVSCRRAWREAMFGQSNTVRGAVLYYNPNVPGIKRPTWDRSECLVATVGAQRFFVS